MAMPKITTIKHPFGHVTPSKYIGQYEQIDHSEKGRSHWSSVRRNVHEGDKPHNWRCTPNDQRPA